jgi:hypothetical protein
MIFASGSPFSNVDLGKCLQIPRLIFHLYNPVLAV